ncbi:MAG: pseudaminic acid synthase [Lachnoclostridium sp.]|nr:pseudaminic acid synthase [Lachnospira sp.]MCM1247806.1 pseudaminic acid synthase [Lachnoclostridium sp.]MCM1534340.1 pseudaminic acid synthase [Clostridium sp.]
MKKEIMIGRHRISEDSPTFIIAEMSANHLMDFDRAAAILRAAKDAGADAVKLQTYTPDTITLNCDAPCFQITQGTIWDGTTLYKLYQTAYTPWEWQPRLKKMAEELGMELFSSPFDFSSVDFLEEMDVPAYKVASFEINDIPLIKRIAQTKKPIIISTGIAYLEDIERALKTCREAGNENVILLKCTSAYPAPYEDINLKTIPSMKEVFDCPVGLSDHTMGSAVAVAGVAMGAGIVEKHLTLRRADGGADAAFSMEPEEFKEMVDNIRLIEKAMGRVTYDLTDKQKKSREHSRSLFVAEDMKAGDVFTPRNLRSVRPAYGLHTQYYEELLGKRIVKDAKAGTPMSWDLVDFEAGRISSCLSSGQTETQK